MHYIFMMQRIYNLKHFTDAGFRLEVPNTFNVLVVRDKA